MAAGLGFKTFTTGEVLTAADTNGYLMQGVLVFASEAARNSAITSPQEGQFAYTKDNNSLWYYTGSAWAASGATGDIEGVTAGTGISGGGTSGTVTITNSMATAIDAKGDLVAGTGADAFSRLGVGANNTILTADSAEATGLKWATPASAGGMTLLSTTSISGLTTTISSIDQGYKDLLLVINKVTCATSVLIRVLGNGSTANTLTGGYDGSGGGWNYDAGPIGITNMTLGTGAVYIYNYASTTAPKIGTANFAANGGGRAISTWFYSQDTEITSIGISNNDARSLTGGTALLYGVK